jgi:DNA-binding transcriptional ArsR family regulator
MLPPIPPNPRNARVERALLTAEIPAYPRSARKRHDRPVREVADLLLAQLTGERRRPGAAVPDLRRDVLAVLSGRGRGQVRAAAPSSGFATIASCDKQFAMPSELASILTALASPTRRRVIQLLSEGPRRAGELAAASGTSAPTMSRHLRVLLKAGIVGDERPSDDARTRVFWLRPESISPLREWLDELQAAGDEQLASFKRHVEGRSGA